MGVEAMTGKLVRLPSELFGVEESKLFILRMSDASMTGADINTGDWVVVAEGVPVNNSDMVAILVKGNTLVRTLSDDAFEPANALYEPVLRGDEKHILGRVVGVVHTVAPAVAASSG